MYWFMNTTGWTRKSFGKPFNRTYQAWLKCLKKLSKADCPWGFDYNLTDSYYLKMVKVMSPTDFNRFWYWQTRVHVLGTGINPGRTDKKPWSDGYQPGMCGQYKFDTSRCNALLPVSFLYALPGLWWLKFPKCTLKGSRQCIMETWKVGRNNPPSSVSGLQSVPFSPWLNRTIIL